MPDLEMLTYIVRHYTTKWRTAGQWKDPDLQDAISFLITEVSEALSLVLTDKDYVRNNDHSEQLRHELADVLLMLIISADLARVDLYAALLEKLKIMDEKRTGDEKTTDQE